MARRWIPRVCAVVFAAGVAGLIIASLNGNNAGVILTIGLAIAIAAVALLTHAALTAEGRADVFADADLERLEGRIATLVESGAPEDELRSLVRDLIGRRRR